MLQQFLFTLRGVRGFLSDLNKLYLFSCKSQSRVLSLVFQHEYLGFVSHLDKLSSVQLCYLVNVTSHLFHTGYVWHTSVLLTAYCTVSCVLPIILKSV